MTTTLGITPHGALLRPIAMTLSNVRRAKSAGACVGVGGRRRAGRHLPGKLHDSGPCAALRWGLAPCRARGTWRMRAVDTATDAASLAQQQPASIPSAPDEEPVGQFAVILEGPDGVATLGPKQQDAFISWINKLANSVPDELRSEGDVVKVELDYMQELPVPGSRASSFPDVDPAGGTPSYPALLVEGILPPDDVLLRSGIVVFFMYRIWRILSGRRGAQDPAAVAAGGATATGKEAPPSAASGRDTTTTNNSNNNTSNSSSNNNNNNHMKDDAIDTNDAKEANLTSNGNGAKPEPGLASASAGADLKRVAMVCNVTVESDADMHEIMLAEQTLLDADDSFDEGLSLEKGPETRGTCLVRRAVLRLVDGLASSGADGMACEDSAAGLKATARLGLPTRLNNPAWYSIGVPTEAREVKVSDVSPGQIFTLSTIMLDVLSAALLTSAVMSADVAAGCFLAYCFSYTLTPLAIFRVLMLDVIYRPLSAFGNVCLRAVASLFRGKAGGAESVGVRATVWGYLAGQALLLAATAGVTMAVAPRLVAQVVVSLTTSIKASAPEARTNQAAQEVQRNTAYTTTTTNKSTKPTMMITYNEFLRILEAGMLSKVEFLSDTKLMVAVNENRGDVVRAIEQASGARGVRNILVHMPPAAFTSQKLSALLDKSKVQVSAAPEAQQSWLGWTLATFGPTLLYLMVISSILNRVSQNQFASAESAAEQANAAGGEESVHTLDDVAGCDDAKAELAEVVDYLKDPQRYSQVGARAPRGVLLVGPPGTGKTLLARAVAGSAHVPFFHASGSSFDDMYVGVGASRIRDLFKRAHKAAPSLIFIDELDAVGTKRHLSRRDDSQTLNQLLTAMDGFNSGRRESPEVIVLAATNRPEVLDAALRRPGRFDRTVTVNLPDQRGRLAVLGLHACTSGLRLKAGIDMRVIAERTMGFSGAGLQGLLNEAALLAARERASAVSALHLTEGIERVAGGIQRLGTVVPLRERLAVACHECGHAIVGAAVAMAVNQLQDRTEKEPWLRDTLHRARQRQTLRDADMQLSVDPTDSLDAECKRLGLPTKVSIVPRGDSALGYTITLPEGDRYLYSEEELRGRLVTLLAGRAAERLVFRRVTSGASDDLQRATELAESIVGRLGMAASVGPRVLVDNDQSKYLGGGSAQRKGYGEHLEALVDQEVSRLLNGADFLALAVLERQRALLDEMVELLMKNEELEGLQLEQLLRSQDVASDDCTDALSVYLQSGQWERQ